MLADGQSIAQIAKCLEVSEQTSYRWRNQYGGMKGPQDEASLPADMRRFSAAHPRYGYRRIHAACRVAHQP